MLLRHPFIFTAVIIFSMLNGWALMRGLKHNNGWSCLMALAAIIGTFYFLHIYQKLRNTSADENDKDGTENPAG